MTFQEACEWIWEEQLGNVMKTANRIAKEWPGSDPDDILQDLILHKEFHISKERVRQIVNDGIRKAKELTLKKEKECTSNLA